MFWIQSKGKSLRYNLFRKRYLKVVQQNFSHLAWVNIHSNIIGLDLSRLIESPFEKFLHYKIDLNKKLWKMKIIKTHPIKMKIINLPGMDMSM